VPLTRDGVTTVGSQTIGYTERQIYVDWDISPDLRSSRQFYSPEAFYRVPNGRYVTQNYIEHVYDTRWVHLEYQPTPITERDIFVYYADCNISERSIYYYPDTGYRQLFVESLYTNTPLLLKYPKYYNWDYVPQVIKPEFTLWSYYPLVEDDIILKVMTDSGKELYVYAKDGNVTIEKKSDTIYKITFDLDEVFDPGEQITCYISVYDIKGNYLKDGLW